MDRTHILEFLPLGEVKIFGILTVKVLLRGRVLGFDTSCQKLHRVQRRHHCIVEAVEQTGSAESKQITKNSLFSTHTQ